MDYGFIKDVKVIDEHTIEFHTKTRSRIIKPDKFETYENTNFTFFHLHNFYVDVYVNGVLLEHVKDIIQLEKTKEDFEECRTHLRLTFAENF